jgi:gliding motility-associated-like protein
VAYTQGDVSGAGGGLLETFTAQTITLRSQTITFGSIPDKKYGDPPFAVTATASSGLSLQYSSSNLSVATVTGNIINVVRPGTTLITVRQAGNATYAPARYTRSLTVTKASLTFTADNKTRPYNEANPELTYTITGFKTGEDQSVIDVLPTIGTTAELSSPAGEYPITITGGSDNNYNFIFVNGILSIIKTDQTITFTNIPLRLLVSESVTLTASSTSGLPVSFESLDPSFATVNGSVLTGVSKGIARIRAFNQGDDNYNAAEALADVDIYSTHKDILNLFTPNNDGINDYWEIPELGAYGKCEVKVYNRWGKLVFASTNYDNRWDGTSDGVNLPEGPYYFVIRHQQNQKVITGTVNILR